jgi:hypothetical protein
MLDKVNNFDFANIRQWGVIFHLQQCKKKFHVTKMLEKDLFFGLKLFVNFL